jgi:hypothetical protein
VRIEGPAVSEASRFSLPSEGNDSLGWHVGHIGLDGEAELHVAVSSPAKINTPGRDLA